MATTAVNKASLKDTFTTMTLQHQHAVTAMDHPLSGIVKQDGCKEESNDAMEEHVLVKKSQDAAIHQENNDKKDGGNNNTGAGC
jgi:hypothetical protein